MNPNLRNLHPYPFEKLASLKHGIVAPVGLDHIALSLGEPKHATPELISEALLSHLAGLSNYPTTKGLPELRQAIAGWLARRYGLTETAVDPETQVLPVNGSREALFSFAQCVVDPNEKALVLMPNPFYQIYEGAALLAGAEPYYLNTDREAGYLPDFDKVPDAVWRRCRLVYVCSPGNPTGAVLTRSHYRQLIELADRYDFAIASDECYSEIYQDESTPPAGLLETAYAMGRTAFERCIVFQSLSKRSNAPGMRSGFVAGDANLLKKYYQYRTYHGCAMPLPTQYASIAAWQDEGHVRDNRTLYRQKFDAFCRILRGVCAVDMPPAAFFVWLKTPIADTDFARGLFEQQNVTVLPGTFLSRPDSNGIDPGKNFVRIALVAPNAECIEAAERIKQFINIL
ncbi:MAG: succinyldiaminopimelate transaminase [Gammaproteobacteria bacterium]